MKLPLKDIKPNPDNPRLIKDEKYKKLVQSLKDFPEMADAREIVINKDHIILGGNMRYKAMQEAGWSEAPVKVVDWPEDKQKEFVIKDNSSFGEYDWDLVANQYELEDLDAWGVDLPEYLTANETEVEEDEAPEVSSEPAVSKLGEVYQLGRHRVMCGDSTDSEAVNKLLNGVVPTLMVTDPPYGVEYDAEWRDGHDANMGKKLGLPGSSRALGKVSNDDRIDWSEAFNLFTGDIAYVWHAGKYAAQVQASLEVSGFEVAYQIIWVKQHFVFGRGDYHWQHEPLWYAMRKGKKHNWNGDRKQTTVWNIQNNNPIGHAKGKEEKTGHSTQKPVECMLRPIVNNSSAGMAVYDPFIGSGSTLIACEQTDRTCYGMELDPKYVDVIRKRYWKFVNDGNEDGWEENTGAIQVEVANAVSK